jgi:2,6-dihydroxypseudooxynicotine hydrolase
VELYDRAARHLVPAAERIEVPIDGVSIPGFLRVPTGERPDAGWPCALLIGGLESTKEEYYAPRSAACDERLKAVVGWGVFFDMSDFGQMPPGTQAGFAFVTGADAFEEGRRLCEEYLDLSDVAGHLRAPFCVLQGRHDAVFAPRQLELVLAGFPNAELEVHEEPDGDHYCHNLAPVVRPRMADWLASQLGATP